MPRCCLGLGGNLGDVPRTLARTAAELNTGAGKLAAFSRVYRTAAVGKAAGDLFLNAAAVLETELAPEGLLDQLQQIEYALGRTREVHWGPRTLDVDLLLYDDLVLHTARLDVPHPGCLYRRFVLDPLTEIAGEWRHPEVGLTIGELRSRLLDRPLPVAVAGGTGDRRERFIAEARRRFPEVALVEWDASPARPGREMVCWLPDAEARSQAGGEEAGPYLLVNLDAPGLDDLPTAVSLMQAMIDEPVPAGAIE